MASATADVRRAELAVTAAKQALAEATMRAPVAGTVAEVPFAKGDQVSTSDAITVIGSGSAQVVVDVPEASIGLLKVGQRATVAVPTTKASAGTVTAIGMLPSEDSTAVSYPVTITVPKPAATLAVGVTASVSITVASPKNVVVVPVSALTRIDDTSGRVTVLGADGRTTSTSVVTIGATGASAVEITKGVTAGQRLVIADRQAALPTTSTSNRRTGTFGGAGGQFGGGPGGGTAGTGRGGR